MKLALLLSLMLISHSANGKDFCGKKPLKIAIIDTGFGYKDEGFDKHLCKYGHRDFSIDGLIDITHNTEVPIPLDIIGHGTNIAGVIEDQINGDGYCFVILKYYSVFQSMKQNLLASNEALSYANNLKVDVINYSGGGQIKDFKEHILVKTFLDKSGIFVAAAGNENQNLDSPENSYFPAMQDKRVIIVGNLSKNKKRVPSSNYGKRVTRWEIGENVTGNNITMTGTSQATAVATGKIVAKILKECENK